MSYSSVVLADSPIRYYRLGEASGTVATDIGSQAQNGTLTGGVTLGQAGALVGDSDTAEQFDGASGYIDCGTYSTGLTSTSMEAWVYSSSLTTQYGMIVEVSPVNNFQALFVEAGSLILRGGSIPGSVIVAAPSNNAWHHIVGTIVGTTGILYVDGVQVAIGDVVAVPSTSGTLYIGCYDGSGYFFSGSIDEGAVYSYALSATQVAAHYTAGITAPVSVLLNPRYIPRALGSTIIPDRVSQPLAYVRRALGSTIIYESRTFVPRAFGGVYLPDTVMWVPRALVGTEQVSLLRSLTLAGVGTLTGALSLTTALTSTLPGVGTLSGTLSLQTALSSTLAGVGALTGTLSLQTALATTFTGIGTLVGTLSTSSAVNLAVTLVGVGTLAGTLSLQTALASTIAGMGTLTGVFSLRVALSCAFMGMGTLAGTLSIAGITTQFLTATWITRDLQATWVTRDNLDTWKTRG